MSRPRHLRLAAAILGASTALMLATATATPPQETIAREGQARVPVPKVPPPDPKSAELPQGYTTEAVLTGLTYPSSVEVDAAGTVYVAEAGYSYGDETAEPRITRILPDGTRDVFIETGLEPPITDLFWSGDRLYIAHRGKVSFWRSDGLHHVVEDLPSFGSHQNNQITLGPDRKLYFGQGTATNSGVVGLDSFTMGWLEKPPQKHDVPPRDLALRTGTTFSTPDPLSTLSGAARQRRQVETSPFHPFGKTGMQATGATKASGTILRMNLDGADLEVYAWGLRNPFGLLWSPDGSTLYAADNGFDERGSRPIANAPDVLWKVEQGAWYGWPDYAAGVPVTDSRFFSERGPAPSFLLEDHPPVERPLATLPVHAGAAKLDISPAHGVFGHPGQLFLALFGDLTPMTGTEMQPSGFEVIRIDPTTGRVHPFFEARQASRGPKGAEYVATGGPRRPIDLRFTPQGDQLLVVDFGAVALVETATGPSPRPIPGSGVLWRITRDGSAPRPLGFKKMNERR